MSQEKLPDIFDEPLQVKQRTIRHIRGPNLVGGVVMWRQHKGDAFAASKMSARRDEEERQVTDHVENGL